MCEQQNGCRHLTKFLKWNIHIVVRRPEPQIGEPGLPYRQFWHPQVEKTLGHLFSVVASQSRTAKQVKHDIKL